MTDARALRSAGSFALLLGFLLAGCVTRPTAEVEGVRVLNTTDEAAVLAFTVVATNTGETELPLRLVDYTLSIEGERVFRGRRSAEATLSRKDRQSVELPVPIVWDDLPVREVRYRLRGKLGYTLPGIFWSAMFDAGLYRPDAEFEFEGTLDASDLAGG
ncbi:MAG: hypothetical protein RIE77_14455 [Phycisphaerales bacterium]|jgi:hypothetical protein